MKLTNLRVSQIQYGDEAGKYRGVAQFSDETGEVALNLSPQHIEEIFRVCADSIVEVSKAAARNLTVRVLEHQQALGEGGAK